MKIYRMDGNHFVADYIAELISFLDHWEHWHKINPVMYPKKLTPEQWEERFFEWQDDKLFGLN